MGKYEENQIVNNLLKSCWRILTRCLNMVKNSVEIVEKK